MPDDYYVSQYSGEEIDALLGGAGAGTVRYDAAQTLTDAQKTQARENIGAAPTGYGLGEGANRVDWNTATQNGFYSGSVNGPNGNTFAGYAYTDPSVGLIQVASGFQNGFLGTARRYMYNGAFDPWEWVNPPMALGVEYRTTERYLGKPVYVQAVNFGTLPNANTKSVTWATSGVVLAVLSVEATSNLGEPIGLGSSMSGTEITATTTTLYIKSSGDYSTNTAVFRVKYTKTTD